MTESYNPSRLAFFARRDGDGQFIFVFQLRDDGHISLRARVAFKPSGLLRVIAASKMEAIPPVPTASMQHIPIQFWQAALGEAFRTPL